MGRQVRYRKIDGIAVLSIANPPINALVPVIRARLIRRLDEIAADPEVKAVVLAGADGAFATGINHSELDEGVADPSLSTLCARLEDLTVPVVAVIQGHAAGAGFELALAAHYRVADPKARLGMPDLAIGLPPWGGASQRLPRIVGADFALHILLGAHAHPVTAPVVAPLIDHVAQGKDTLQVAIVFAKGLVSEGLGPRRSSERTDGFEDAQGYLAAVEKHKAKLERAGSNAERAVVQMVEAAQLLPFEAGVEMELAAFDDLVDTPRAKAMRHVMRAERRCGRLVGAAEPEVRDFGLIFANPQNTRAAGAILLTGARVRLFDPTPGAADKGKEAVIHRLKATAARRGLADTVVTAMARNITTVSSLADLDVVQIILENGPDDSAARGKVLSRLNDVIGSKTPVLCLTDHLDCAALAPDDMQNRVMGLSICDMDFPARLAELSIARSVSDQAVLIAQAALKRIDRRLIRSVPGQGLIGPAMLDAYLAAADALVRAGIAPRDIDAAMQDGGFARGPYALLASRPFGSFVKRAERAGRGDGFSVRLLRGGLGAHLRGLDAPELVDLAAECHDSNLDGVFELATPKDIRTAICAALVNRGVALIEQGTARRPMQIDVAMIQGYGYPRDRGGPMCHADIVGLFQTVRRGQAMADLDSDLWTPRPLFLDLQRNGKDFASLNP